MLNKDVSSRQRLLSAGLDEFLAHGFGGASTRRITTAAGVSHGLLFHNFDSKAGLYLELIRIATARTALDEVEATARPLAYFAETATGLLAMMRDDPRTARMFVFMDHATSHPGLVAEADELLRQHDVVDRCVGVVKAGQALGEIRPGSPRALALVFWAALQGVAREAWADPTSELPEPDWLLDLLRATRSTT